LQVQLHYSKAMNRVFERQIFGHLRWHSNGQFSIISAGFWILQVCRQSPCREQEFRGFAIGPLWSRYVSTGERQRHFGKYPPPHARHYLLLADLVPCMSLRSLFLLTFLWIHDLNSVWCENERVCAALISSGIVQLCFLRSSLLINHLDKRNQWCLHIYSHMESLSQNWPFIEATFWNFLALLDNLKFVCRDKNAGITPVSITYTCLFVYVENVQSERNRDENSHACCEEYPHCYVHLDVANAWNAVIVTRSSSPCNAVVGTWRHARTFGRDVAKMDRSAMIEWSAESSGPITMERLVKYQQDWRFRDSYLICS